MHACFLLRIYSQLQHRTSVGRAMCNNRLLLCKLGNYVSVVMVMVMVMVWEWRWSRTSTPPWPLRTPSFDLEPSGISQLTTTTITENLSDFLIRDLVCRTSVAYVALLALPFTWLLLQPNRFSDQ
jgi:hypothetical protein